MLKIVLFLTFLVIIKSSPLVFTVDTTSFPVLWDHYWEECVGSGHAALALRSDYREALLNGFLQFIFFIILQ